MFVFTCSFLFIFPHSSYFFTFILYRPSCDSIRIKPLHKIGANITNLIPSLFLYVFPESVDFKDRGRCDGAAEAGL